jgi:3-oxoacyl-[acyl-carrier protein] reductase
MAGKVVARMGSCHDRQCQRIMVVQPRDCAGDAAAKAGKYRQRSSNMAFNGGLTMMHYVTSKAAVVGFSRVLARELGADNNRVNTLAPGATMSEEKATEQALKNYQRSASTRILKRIEQPEDLVGTALYLLSDLSTFVTGQTIVVNGGAVLH